MGIHHSNGDYSALETGVVERMKNIFVCLVFLTAVAGVVSADANITIFFPENTTVNNLTQPLNVSSNETITKWWIVVNRVGESGVFENLTYQFLPFGSSSGTRDISAVNEMVYTASANISLMYNRSSNTTSYVSDALIFASTGNSLSSIDATTTGIFIGKVTPNPFPCLYYYHNIATNSTECRNSTVIGTQDPYRNAASSIYAIKQTGSNAYLTVDTTSVPKIKNGTLLYYNSAAPYPSIEDLNVTNVALFTNGIRGVDVDASGNAFFVGRPAGGQQSPIGLYTRSSNTTTDLRSLVIGDWTNQSILYGTARRNPDGFYFSGSKCTIGFYNQTANSINQISCPFNDKTSTVWGIKTDIDGNAIFVTSNALIGFYNSTSNESSVIQNISQWVVGGKHGIAKIPDGVYVSSSSTQGFGLFNMSNRYFFLPNSTVTLTNETNNVTVFAQTASGSIVSKTVFVSYSPNSPPTASPTLTPANAQRTDVLFANGTVTDSETISGLKASWKLFNGSSVYAFGSSGYTLNNGTVYNFYNLSANTTHTGEVWRFELMGDDGTVNGTAVNSTAVVIHSSNITIDNVTLVVVNLGGNQTVKIIVAATDIDGGSDLNTTCFKNICNDTFTLTDADSGYFVLNLPTDLFQDGLITAYDTHNGSATWVLNFSVTNNLYVQDTSFSANLTVQRIKKTDTINNLDNTYHFFFNVTHSQFDNGSLVSGGSFSGEQQDATHANPTNITSVWAANILNASRTSTTPESESVVQFSVPISIRQNFSLLNTHYYIDLTNIQVDFLPHFDQSVVYNVTDATFFVDITANTTQNFSVLFEKNIVSPLNISVSDCPVGASYFITFCRTFNQTTVGDTAYRFYRTLTKLNVTDAFANQSTFSLAFSKDYYLDWGGSNLLVNYIKLNGDDNAINYTEDTNNIYVTVPNIHTFTGSLINGTYVVDFSYQESYVYTTGGGSITGGATGGGGGGGSAYCGNGICEVAEDSSLCPADCGNVTWSFTPPYRVRQTDRGSCDKYDFVVTNLGEAREITMLFEDSGDGSALWNTFNGTSSRTIINLAAGTLQLPSRKSVSVMTCVPNNAEYKTYRFTLSSIANNRKLVAPVEVQITKVPAPITILENAVKVATTPFVIPSALPAVAFLFTPLTWIFATIIIMSFFGLRKANKRRS
jgi:hypothetical protein